MRGTTAMEVLITLMAIVMMFMVSSRGIFASEQVAIRTLETSGFTDVAITDKKWFFVGLRGCGGDDAVRFDATATNSLGKKVGLYVCTGWPFKGGTIRS